MKRKLRVLLDQSLSLDLTMRTAFPRAQLFNHLVLFRTCIYSEFDSQYVYIYIGIICQPRIQQRSRRYWTQAEDVLGIISLRG